MGRYVFSELLAVDRLIAPPTLALLAKRDVQLYAAITPAVRERAAEIAAACRDAGVRLGVWPMIDDERGRWASAWTGVAFADYCRRLLDDLDRSDCRPAELLVDLEPPIALARMAVGGRPTLAGPPPRVGARALRALVTELDAEGVAVSAAAHPWSVAGLGAGPRGWQRAMGTPIDELPFCRVFAMAYTSLIEGYSRGLLPRRHAEAALAAWSKGVGARLQERTGIAVGAVGVGALGDERPYRGPDELARDVAIAVANGAEHIAAFNLGGMLDRSPAEAWLDALCFGTAGEVAAPPSLRVGVAGAALDASGRVLDLVLRWRR